MTEYAKLVLAEATCHTIEIREKATYRGQYLPGRDRIADGAATADDAGLRRPQHPGQSQIGRAHV